MAYHGEYIPTSRDSSDPPEDEARSERPAEADPSLEEALERARREQELDVER